MSLIKIPNFILDTINQIDLIAKYRENISPFLVSLILTLIIDAFKIGLAPKKCERSICTMHYDGKIREQIKTKISSSIKTVKIMYVSGHNLIKNNQQQITNALINGAHVKFLIADPHGVFIKDIDIVEGRPIDGSIANEIKMSLMHLQECFNEATKKTPRDKTINLSIGYFNTSLRSSLIICDDIWCNLTLNLPPKRSNESLSLEISSYDDANKLLLDCIMHFDSSWDMASKIGENPV